LKLKSAQCIAPNREAALETKIGAVNLGTYTAKRTLNREAALDTYTLPVQTDILGQPRLATMTVLVLNADRAVPITGEAKNVDLRERISAAAATLDLLTGVGYDFDVSQEDIDAANEIALTFAADPMAISKAAGVKEVSSLSPATVALVKTILDEFGREIIENTKAIRNLVINKLIIESENPDARVRLRSIELLGKLSDVALFTERSEVLITHQSTDDLKQKLKDKLEKLKGTTLRPNADGVYEADDVPQRVFDVPIIETGALDCEEELAQVGFDD